MKPAKRSLVVVGSGFAGVWAALSAARERHALGREDDIEIRVISPHAYLGIRPRFYEAALADTTVELSRIFAPVGVAHVRDRVVGLDPAQRTLALGGGGTLRYDALVWALGSAVVRPSMPGAEHLHSVDTHGEAEALDRHLRRLAATPAEPETVVVVGAGFTGLEAATELVDRMKRRFRAPRVVLVERAGHVAPEFGPDARAVIEAALAALGVEVRTGATVAELTEDRVTLTTGEAIAARTVVWTAGVHAHPATRGLGPPADALGRIAVDANLRVSEAIWAAGDVARALVDGAQPAAMSCQHALPQGRYAGHNALRALAGRSPKRYEQRLYLTCLDLGAWGALLTCGFDRNRILASGADAKPFKQFINTVAIYPPLDGSAPSLYKAAALPPGGRIAAALTRWAVGSRRVRKLIVARSPAPQLAAA